MLTEEQKSKVLEKYKQFIYITQKVSKFENEIKKLSDEHEKVITELEKIREDVKKMEADLCINEDNKQSYTEFLNDILIGKVKLN